MSGRCFRATSRERLQFRCDTFLTHFAECPYSVRIPFAVVTLRPSVLKRHSAVQKIRTSCDHCSTQLSVPESAAGKKIRCPKCKNICLVTAPDRTELGHQGSGVDEAKAEWSLADPWGSFTPSIAKAADSNGIENSAEQLPLTESPQTLHKNAKSVPPRREAPALTETQWFFDENGKRRGPVSESELIQFINTGSVTRGTFVWTRGFPDWLKVENTELHPYLDDSVPPPLYGTQINNTIVWTLASHR